MSFSASTHAQATIMVGTKPALIDWQYLRTIQVHMTFAHFFKDTKQPFPSRFIFQIMTLLVVVFALVAGYYQARLSIWRENHIKVLQKFDVFTTKELLEKKVEVQ